MYETGRHFVPTRSFQELGRAQEWQMTRPREAEEPPTAACQPVMTAGDCRELRQNHPADNLQRTDPFCYLLHRQSVGGSIKYGYGQRKANGPWTGDGAVLVIAKLHEECRSPQHCQHRSRLKMPETIDRAEAVGNTAILDVLDRSVLKKVITAK